MSRSNNADTTRGSQASLLGELNRREFLRRAALVTGGSLLGLGLACAAPAATATPAPTPTAAPSPTSPPAPTPTLGPGMTVSPTDPRIEAGAVEFSGAGGAVLGYLARPKDAGPHPAVIVIHENRGLLPHFPDVARRLAVEGYAALAVDLVSRRGGTGAFADGEAAGAALREISQEDMVADLNTAVDYLQAQSYVRPERVGVMGFCFGGGLTWLLAVRNPEIQAAVPFYGSAPPVAEVPDLEAAALGIYAGNDSRINAGIPDLEAALKQHGKGYKFITYPGADHAFFNDTGTRYNPEAARQAWRETLNWFDQHLKQA